MMSLSKQRRYKCRLLKTIQGRSGNAAAGTIGASLLERERQRFLASHAVHCATLHAIWAAKDGVAVADARWEAAQMSPMAVRDYRRFRSRPVEWHQKRRSTAGFRQICHFGDVEKMWHTLAQELITAQHQPRPHIGDWAKRGRDCQMVALTSLIHSPWQAVVVADVRKAFASVNFDAVYDLHFLPEPLIRRALDYRTHRFVRRERSVFVDHPKVVHGTSDEVTPHGLMEGSPASNAIFSVLLDDLPDHLGNDITVFTYCDNIVCLAPSILRAHRAEQALVRYFAGHRAGPFELRVETKPVTSRFDHLGYSIHLDQDGLRVELAPKNWTQYMERVEDEAVGPAGAVAWLRQAFPHLTQADLTTLLQVSADEEIASTNRPHGVLCRRSRQ